MSFKVRRIKIKIAKAHTQTMASANKRVKLEYIYDCILFCVKQNKEKKKKDRFLCRKYLPNLLLKLYFQLTYPS